MDMAQEIVDASGRGMATITLASRDLSLRNLVCVGDRLEQENPLWTEVRVAVFDSTDAADHYYFDWRTVEGTSPPRRELAYESLRRAVYVVSKSAGTRYLELRLFGADDERFQTRIDLPVKERPRCRFEINGRCLLVATAPTLPQVMPALVSGSVTLSAQAQPDGTFKGVQVAKAVTEPAEAAEFVSKLVAANVQTWRVDSASSEDSLTINYHFVTDVEPAPSPVLRGIGRAPVIEMPSSTTVTVKQRVWK